MKEAVSGQLSAISKKRSAVRRDRRIDLGDGWYTFESCQDFAIFSGEPAAGAVDALQEAIVDSLVVRAGAETKVASVVLPSLSS